MGAAGFAKAAIVKLDKNGKPVRPEVKVMFNPKELTFAKQNNWKPLDSPKGEVPPLEFVSGGAATLKIQLYFDTYATGAKDSETKDVRKEYTDAIYKMMQVDIALKDKKN